jgi:hypothetical protein
MPRSCAVAWPAANIKAAPATAAKCLIVASRFAAGLLADDPAAIRQAGPEIHLKSS